MKPKVLVFGWYNHGNLGDNFFADIFKTLFPNFEFSFVDYIDEKILKDQDAIFLGGGSFLDQTSTINAALLPLLKSKPIFYLGVGSETNISPIHIELLKVAKLIAIRSSEKLEFIKTLNSNVILIPDLIYYQSLITTITPAPKPKSVLILPNVAVLPQGYEPHWKHMAWEYFKFEFAQFLDSLIESEHQIKFFPMCKENKLSDDWAATEIFSKMRRRKNSFLFEKRTETITDTLDLFAQYETIITQRYHGVVLAEIAKVPYITISHHDKLKNVDKNSISFYGFNKQIMEEKFKSVKRKEPFALLPIKTDIFIDIKKKIEALLIGG